MMNCLLLIMFLYNTFQVGEDLCYEGLAFLVAKIVIFFLIPTNDEHFFMDLTLYTKKWG